MAITIAGLRVINFELSQSEGEAAVLSATVGNQGLAALAGISGMHTLSGVPGVGFRGMVHSFPSDLADLRVTVEFVAQPSNWTEKLKDYADGLRSLPYYDPLFYGGEKPWGQLDENGDVIEDDRDPAEVLDARSAHFLLDPETHSISLSDVAEGGAGTILVDKVYDAGSLKPMLTGSVVNEVTAELIVEWNQSATGKVDIGGRLTPFATGLTTLTDPSSISDSGDIGNDSGWSVEAAEWRVQEGVTAEKYRTGEFTDVEYVKRDINGLVIDQKTEREAVVAPLKSYTCWAGRTWASFDYSQARRETVTLRMRSDAQQVLGERKKESLGSFSLADVTYDHSTQEWRPDTPYQAGDRVQIGGKGYEALRDIEGAAEFSVLTQARYLRVIIKNFTTGTKSSSTTVIGPPPEPQWKEIPLQAALPDARSASFIDTARGQQALAHLALRMRAYLRKNMRAYSLTFRGPWETLCGVTLDHNVRVMHWSLPGGSVTGKVTSYRKVWRGEDPGRTAYVEVTLGLCAGSGALPDLPEPDSAYSEAFEAGYAAGSGPRTVSAGSASVTVTGPEPIQVVDPYRLRDPYYAVRQVTWEDTDSDGWQRAVARAADRELAKAMERGDQELPPTAAEAVSGIATSYSVRMRKLHSGGVLVRRLKGSCGVARTPKNIVL